MSNEFLLDERLAADTLEIGDLSLSRVLLMNDRRYPWVILVPRRAGIREWIDLPDPDAQQLWLESMQVCRVLRDNFGGDKLNIGALGNVVEQLHVHHVVRTRQDPAWPGPVWGHSAAEPYARAEAESVRHRLGAALLS